MALASVNLLVFLSELQAGGATEYGTAPAGLLASLNNAAVTWQGEQNCAANVTGRLADTASGANGYGVSGAVSAQSIASGDGYVEFMAAVPPAIPQDGYPAFGGRMFFAGLTHNTAAKAINEIDHAIEVGLGGVSIYEAGVYKRTIRAARQNGRYRVGIEGGAVVYRADDEIIYRSDLPPVYPARLGAIFFHRSIDAIGGTATEPVTMKAVDQYGYDAGTFDGGQWIAPLVRGAYTISATTPEYVTQSQIVQVGAVFPNMDNTDCFPCPNKFRRVRAKDQEFNVRRNVFDDRSANYHLPYTDKTYIWELVFTGLSDKFANILDDFYEQHFADGYWFYFFDPRERNADGSVGQLFDNVRFESYESDHRRLYSNSQSRRIRLMRRPR